MDPIHIHKPTHPTFLNAYNLLRNVIKHSLHPYNRCVFALVHLSTLDTIAIHGAEFEVHYRPLVVELNEMAAQIPDLELTIQKLLYQLEKYRRAKRAELEEKEEDLKVHASKIGGILEHVGEVGIVQGVEELKGVKLGLDSRCPSPRSRPLREIQKSERFEEQVVYAKIEEPCESPNSLRDVEADS